jgi:hypothetical protein
VGVAVSDDIYVVTVDGPDGTRIRRAFSQVTIDCLRAGPQDPHAKAAYIASIEIQAYFDRDKGGVTDGREQG